MSYEPPTPPSELPPEMVEDLNEFSPERLHDIASYVQELVEYKERENRLAEKPDEKDVEERPDSLPSDVPSKATITIKEINDNRYYYWQWREGEKIRSKYKGPVNSTD